MPIGWAPLYGTMLGGALMGAWGNGAAVDLMRQQEFPVARSLLTFNEVVAHGER